MELLTLDKLPQRILKELDLESMHRVAAVMTAAERFKLFRKLSGKSLTSAEIGRRTGMNANYRDVFLNILTALGMLRKKGNRYSNSKLAEKHLVKDRADEWTERHSAEMAEEQISFTYMEQVLKTGKSVNQLRGLKNQDYVEMMRKNPKRARDFTYMLYHYHQPHARELAKVLDLSKCQRLLDVGGGSGVMTIALAKKYKNFTATVMDIKPVCITAHEIIKKNKLQKRIDTFAGNILKDVPEGYDCIMTSDVGTITYDMLDMIYKRLEPGGMVVMNDLFFYDDRTGPIERLFWKLISSDRRIFTVSMYIQKMRTLGFKSIKKRNMLDGMILLTAKKM